MQKFDFLDSLCYNSALPQEGALYDRTQKARPANEYNDTKYEAAVRSKRCGFMLSCSIERMSAGRRYPTKF